MVPFSLFVLMSLQIQYVANKVILISSTSQAFTHKNCSAASIPICVGMVPYMTLLCMLLRERKNEYGSLEDVKNAFTHSAVKSVRFPISGGMVPVRLF